MATMSKTWSVFIVVTLLAVQLCKGQKSCAIWSSAGPVVQRDTSFVVYCTFNCKCKGSMYGDQPLTQQSHIVLNSTTIYFNVVNITENKTYSCLCKCHPVLDPCGLDISAGYPPDRPKNISCIYKVTSEESGVVFCTWNRGRDTYLRNSSVLCATTVSGNHTVLHNVSSKGTGVPSVTFNVSRSAQLLSVWVRAQNPLGSAVSSTVNYTLSSIAMPSAPVLRQIRSSSRECVIAVQQPVRAQHLEIQYKAAEHTWASIPDQVVRMNTAQEWSISSLEPYRLYHFRARSKFSSGLWSQWSTNTSCQTLEEAPEKELDVWFASSGLRSLRVYWKEANISITRGKITGYKVRVYSPDSGLDVVKNLSADARNYSVSTCANCEVTVWSHNSQGLSPPARITAHHTKANSSQDVQVKADGQNVTICWRKPKTAPLPTAYVVEWYPQGHKLEELRWVRLGMNANHTVITDMKPFECYSGAVYVFYGESSVSRAVFAGVTTLESAPAAGPLVEEKVEGHSVKVTWTELPRSQRGGCITSYTIYLENKSGDQQSYSTAASVQMYVIKDLSPGVYSLWVTASTVKGEGPASHNKLKFFIQEESPLSFLLVCATVLVTVLLFVCLCQSSAVKRKFWVFFQCLMLDVVPDPANSKWAKECTKEKGKMNLQLQLSNSSAAEEEEEPILVDVEELPRQNSDISTPASVSLQLPRQISLSPETKAATLPYPLTTYIKSISHDSDSSDHTQTSLDTTVDYISSHGMGHMEDEDDQEDEEEEEELIADVLSFLPSHNIFPEPLGFGGKLTLDAVKIDCSSFFQNS